MIKFKHNQINAFYINLLEVKKIFWNKMLIWEKYFKQNQKIIVTRMQEQVLITFHRPKIIHLSDNYHLISTPNFLKRLSVTKLKEKIHFQKWINKIVSLEDKYINIRTNHFQKKIKTTKINESVSNKQKIPSRDGLQDSMRPIKVQRKIKI